jgi:AcrR family transcriptional regulator
MSGSSLRARVRSEFTEEIKAAARQRLATDGANLSLRAVARDLGMVPSALYRYFPSRDDLLTALIMEGYQAIAQAARQAEGKAPRADARGRWLATGHAVRDWALAHPAQYGLLYGTPVPGYSAPQDTVAPASSVIFILIEIAASAAPAEVPPAAALPEPLRADLRRLIDQHGGGIGEVLLERVFAAWTHLYGLVSFELFGRLDGTIQARREYFDHQMGLMADLAGLPA